MEKAKKNNRNDKEEKIERVKKEETQKNISNKNILLICLLVFIVILLVVKCTIFKESNPGGPNNNSNTTCGNDRYKYEPAEYGILVAGEINPYKDLDFSIKELSIYLTIKEDGILYSNGNMNQEVTLPIKNAIQVGLDYDCNGYYGIYYLTNSKELYLIELKNGLLKNNYKSKLISKNVEGIYFLERSITKKTTCTSYDLIVKYNNGKMSVNGCDSEALERLLVRNIGENHELYLVSENAKVKNYLTDENGEKLVAKKVYIRETDSYGVIEHNVYVLNENDYLYYAKNFNETNLSKYNESKVKNIKIGTEYVEVKFEDGTSAEFFGDLIYDINS